MQMMMSRWCVPVLAIAMMAPKVNAGAITSYTATDLGLADTVTYQPTYQLSNTGADGTLTTSAGAVYAFPRTDNEVANPKPLLATFPPFTNAPVDSSATYGNPNFAYSFFNPRGVFLNSAGEFVAFDIYGVASHAESSGTTVYTATRQADGTFGALTALWSSSQNFYSGGQIASALDLNNSGLILGATEGSPLYSGSRDFFLYNLHSGVKTELASLLPIGWTIASPPIAIDDQGRVLVSADKPYVPGQNTNGDQSELLLLTPAGLSSAPIPAPEPSTFAILAVAGAGWLIRRRWKKSLDGAITSTNR